MYSERDELTDQDNSVCHSYYKMKMKMKQNKYWKQQRISEKRSLQIANTENEETVDILLCCDEKDRFPMYTLINSIIQNEPELERLHFHILVLKDVPLFLDEIALYFGEYLNEIRFEFKSIVDDHRECIEFSDIASTTLPAKQTRNWLNNIMNFARFCIPNVFENVHIGIYLDVDMVVQRSISSLYDDHFSANKNGLVAWSVMNRSPYKHTFRNEEKSRFLNNYFNRNMSSRYPSVASEPLNFSEIKHLFNAGIFVFDFEVWRRRKFTEQSIELFKFNRIYSNEFNKKPWNGVTQPILNVLLIINEIEVEDLGNEWNFVIKDVVGTRRCTKKLDTKTKRILESKHVLHWAGGCKPWTVSGLNTAYLWLRYIPRRASISRWERHFNLTLV